MRTSCGRCPVAFQLPSLSTPSCTEPTGTVNDEFCFRYKKFQRLLRTHRLTGSMGHVASAADNAGMESFFNLLQTNVFDRQRWDNRTGPAASCHSPRHRSLNVTTRASAISSATFARSRARPMNAATPTSSPLYISMDPTLPRS